MDPTSPLEEVVFLDGEGRLRHDEEDEEEDKDSSDEDVLDLHVCGKCKSQFSTLDGFSAHKRLCHRKKAGGRATAGRTGRPLRSALDPAITPQEPPSSSSAPVVASPDVTCSVNVGEFVLPDLAEVAGDDREAEEAAVISLLANQLSSHHSSLVNAVSETREPPFPPAATTAPSSPLLRDDDVDDHLHGQADRLEDVMAAVIPATETKTKQRKKAAKRSSNKRKKTPKAAPEKVKKAKAEPIPCPEEGCPFVAVYNKDMIRHKRIHTGERPFKCSTCQKTFTRSDKLKQHERAVHAGARPYTCPRPGCSYAAAESGSLVKHLRVHDDQRPYKCQICPYRSRDASQLTVHLRTHTGDCPFVCNRTGCVASFKTRSDLVRHSRTHSGEKPFACTLCSYKCAIKSNLRTHVRVNHRETVVPDSLLMCKARGCSYKAASKARLKKHEEEEHKDSLFRCNKGGHSCDFRAASRQELTAHTRRVHQGQQAQTLSEESPADAPGSSELHQRRCPYCDRTFAWEGALSAHVNKKHGRQTSGSALLKTSCATNFECGDCGAAFVRHDSYRSHQRQHEKNKMAQTVVSTDVPVLPETSADSVSVDQEIPPTHASPASPASPVKATFAAERPQSPPVAHPPPPPSASRYLKSDPVMSSALVVQQQQQRPQTVLLASADQQPALSQLVPFKLDDQPTQLFQAQPGVQYLVTSDGLLQPLMPTAPAVATQQPQQQQVRYFSPVVTSEATVVSNLFVRTGN